jgi:hypothetical protein
MTRAGGLAVKKSIDRSLLVVVGLTTGLSIGDDTLAKD